jgi:luciferase family oxidoreductase group 1
MLPNHAPLVIAEQFGTLETLYPGRIDLGVGRAPGTDQITAYALRRSLVGTDDGFPGDVMELLAYFQPTQPGQRVRAVPGAGLNVPVWLLGSSLYSAQLAAHLGLPFAFASHFAPEHLLSALGEYRAGFKPSAYLDKPYSMAALNVVGAETESEARHLFTTMQQQFTNLVRGKLGLMQPPVDDMDAYWQPHEKAAVERMMTCSVYGDPDGVARGIADFIARTGIDELMVTARVFDPAAAHRSLEIVAEARTRLAESSAPRTVGSSEATAG